MATSIPALIFGLGVLLVCTHAIPVDSDVDLLDVIRQQEARISQLETVLHQLQSLANDVKIKEPHRHADLKEPLKIKGRSFLSSKALGATGCMDLWREGQILPGYYPVVLDNKVQFVYCNKDELAEVFIGYADVKSSPIHFYAARPGGFKNDNRPITIVYPNAITYHPSLDLISGRFTAPVTGTYHFSFYGYSYTRSLAGDATSEETRVTLLKNSFIEVAWNYNDSEDPVDATLTFTAIVSLNAGEWVETRFDYGNIHECHLSGFLIEGELASE